MYNISTVETAFLSLVGWNQNPDSSGWQLTGLTSSDSGIFMNSLHSSLTIENLISIAPRFDQIHSGDDAARNTAFTNWLTQIHKNAIIEAMGTWIDTKIGRKTAKSLLADGRLFDMAGSFDHLQPKITGRFVGIAITPLPDKGVAGKIKKVGFQFNQGETVNLRLFSSGDSQQLQTAPVTYTGTGGIQWEDVNWDIESGKTYYLGYHEDELTGQAINGAVEYNYNALGVLRFPTERHFNSNAFSVSRANDTNMWAVRGNQYTVGTNFGLNVDLDFKTDYTNLIVEQKLIFARFVALQLAINIIKELITNPNSKINRNTSNSAAMKAWLKDEINGNKVDKNDTSLAGKYRLALEAIQFEYNQVNDTLLPEIEDRPRFETLGPEWIENGWY